MDNIGSLEYKGYFLVWYWGQLGHLGTEMSVSEDGIIINQYNSIVLIFFMFLMCLNNEYNLVLSRNPKFDFGTRCFTKIVKDKKIFSFKIIIVYFRKKICLK